MQCSAMSKRSRQQCKGRAVTGRTTCRMHGGTIPRGYGLPQTKHGRYSKLLPLRLAQRYDEARNNKDLLSLKDDIAAAEARLGDLFQRVDTGESGALWQAVRDTLGDLDAAIVDRDMVKANTHLTALRRVVTQGTEDYAAWAEILRTWQVRCQLTSTQAKVLIAAQQMVSAEQLVLYLGVITHAIQQAVSTHADAAVAHRILADLSAEFTRISLLERGADA